MLMAGAGKAADSVRAGSPPGSCANIVDSATLGLSPMNAIPVKPKIMFN